MNHPSARDLNHIYVSFQRILIDDFYPYRIDSKQHKMASGRSARLPQTPNTTNTRHSEMNPTSAGFPPNMTGETMEALGPDLAVATSQVLDSLSDRERQMILEVLHRDEGVRQRDAARIM